MNLNPLSRIGHKITVPRPVSSVATIAEDREVDPEWLGISESDKESLWIAVKDLYRAGVYPALSICIRRHGEILLDRAIGYARGGGPDTDDYEGKVLATPDTPFCLFSISKVITAMLMLKLEEMGEVNLLNAVAHYIPEFGANGKENITIYQVLTHRAGLADFKKTINPEVFFDHDELMRLLYEAAPSTAAGMELSYHALIGGYICAELVKRVVGQDIRAFLREQLQEPLGMKYFNYGVPGAEYHDIARNYLTGYPLVFPVKQVLTRVMGTSLEKAIEMVNDPRFYQEAIPSANLTCTAEECSRFFQMLLDGGKYESKRVFEAATVERATRADQTGFDRGLLMPMRYSVGGMMLGNHRVSLYGRDTAMAYGHLGLTNNFAWADPERQISVTLLTSGNPVYGSYVLRLIRLLNRISSSCSKVSGE